MTVIDPATLTTGELIRLSRRLAEVAERHRYNWSRIARPEQLPPDQFLVWLILAGRGFGKTRTGAETVRKRAQQPGHKVAVIAKTHREAQRVCFDHRRSGLRAVIPPAQVAHYQRKPGEVELTLTNGSTFTAFSAEEPDAIRGNEYDTVWGDEYAAWPRNRAQDMFDQAYLTLREAEDPAFIVTTTPKPLPHVKELVEDCKLVPDYYLTTGRTDDNAANLNPRFLAELHRRYDGTSTGAQELDAVLLGEVEDALVSLAILDRYAILPGELPALAVTVTAVDPATTTKEGSDLTGIVVSGLSSYGELYVLDDRSGKHKPNEWGRLTWETAIEHGSAAVVIEDNAGGDMCEHTLVTAWQLMVHDLQSRGKPVPPRPGIVRVTPAGATQSKWARAQPIGLLYREGRVHHVRDPRRTETVTRSSGREVTQPMLRALEDQLSTWSGRPGEDSPDRVDALVHGATWMLYPPRRGHQSGALALPPADRWSRDQSR